MTYIGKTDKEFKNGNSYDIDLQDMSGRVYEPGWVETANNTKDFTDKVGKPDLRVMCSSSVMSKVAFYRVYPSAENLLENWDIQNHTGSHRVNVIVKQRALENADAK